jgi:hypothetical protein
MTRFKSDRWRTLSSAVGEPLAISLIIAVLVVNGALAYTNINSLDDSHGLVAGSGHITLALERFAKLRMKVPNTCKRATLGPAMG